jgi:ATP-dependent Clp protease adaptor protein ClpS
MARSKENPSQGRQKPASEKTKRTGGEGYRVLLYNDDEHTMEEVVVQIVMAINCPITHAEEIMLRAHTQGCATVVITGRNEAHRVARVLREIGLIVVVDQV